MTDRNFDFTGRIGRGEYGGKMARNYPEMDDLAGVAALPERVPAGERGGVGLWVRFSMVPAGFWTYGCGSHRVRCTGKEYYAGIRVSRNFGFLIGDFGLGMREGGFPCSEVHECIPVTARAHAAEEQPPLKWELPTWAGPSGFGVTPSGPVALVPCSGTESPKHE